jgi:hypothetical protein
MQANVTMAANSARCGSQHDAATMTDPWLLGADRKRAGCDGRHHAR